MNNDYYTRKKTRAKALLDIIVKTPIQRVPDKKNPGNGHSPFRVKSKQRLRRTSSEVPLQKKQAMNIKSLSLPIVTCPESRGVAVDAEEELSLKTDNIQASFDDVLSFQNFSKGRTSIFKLRDAGSRLLCSATSSDSSENFSEKMRSTWACPSLPSISCTSKEDLPTSKQSSSELSLQHVDSDIISSSLEFLRNSPSLLKVEDDSDYHTFPPVPGSDSAVSDWRDHFVSPDSDSELNGDITSLERRDSNSRSWSYNSWSSSTSSRKLKPTYKSSCKPKDLPPPGMLFVAWLNTRTGNRFSTFHLDTKLGTVIKWLGNPLPIVVQEPESCGRRCDTNVTLAQALGKRLKSPSQQGLAFFIGPVNSKLSYLMKVCDLYRLCALSKTEDEEKEKRKAWL